MDLEEFPYSNYLKEMFPNQSSATIVKTISIVQNETPFDNPEHQLENMINLLTNMQDDISSGAEAQAGIPQRENEEDLLDEARGESRTINESELSAYFEQLLNIFPDASPSYVLNLCNEQTQKFVSFDNLIDKMLEADYPKKEVDPRKVYNQLKEMLPNADPRYLQTQADVLAYQPQQHLEQFVEDAIEKGEYPTMEDYLKDKKENEKINQYTTEFNIRRFLQQFPDPEKHFSDLKRQSSFSAEEEKAKEEELYTLSFMYNHYSYLRRKDIDKIFKMNFKNLLRTCNKLDTLRKATRLPRKTVISDMTPVNIPLLQEIAYLKYRKDIKKILKEYDINYKLAKDEARRNCLLQTCGCCYDDELIPEECYFCKNGCIFCRECVKGGAEVVVGEGKLDFPCLADCGAEFSIPTLQMVLESVVFSRMAQRKQMEEIKRANIDGLETCPFCDFATIPNPDDKIFQCLNEDCRKESCRECRHVAHIPLRCNEIEYDEDVKMRTYIENKMTEALLRKCWKCGKVFIKESGCNKMTCSCGAYMCYVCGVAVTDYKHFGENNSTRCPLWTKDLNRFHADAVYRGAADAKADLGIDKNPKLLKNDPSKNLKDHYAF